MTDALEFYIKDWERIIWDATGDQTKVDRLMELARLNGMFDPVKMVPAPQALAATPAVDSGEAIPNRDGMDGTDRLCQALYGRKAAARDYLGGSDARMLHDAADRLAATPAVGGDARKWIIDLIHSEYDPKPSDYRLGDNWNDGAEEIADQILERLRNV